MEGVKATTYYFATLVLGDVYIAGDKTFVSGKRERISKELYEYFGDDHKHFEFEVVNTGGDKK